MSAALNGSFEGFGLAGVLRLLAGARVTGRLEAVTGEPTDPLATAPADASLGYVALDRGRVVGAGLSAALGGAVGLGALEALTLFASAARLKFRAGTPESERSVSSTEAETLLGYLDRLEAMARAVGIAGLTPTAVPRKIPVCPAAADDGAPPAHGPAGIDGVDGVDGVDGNERVVLERGALNTLLYVDGVRSVADILSLRETADALIELASLAEMRLVQFDAVAPAGAAAPHSPTPDASGGWRAELHYWSRSGTLAAAAGALLALTAWRESPPPLIPGA
jgi:hypothetical protein